MKKEILFLLGVLVCLSVSYACIFPDTFGFYHPIDMVILKTELKSERIDFSEVDKNIVLNYDDFILEINENGVEISCKEVFTSCMDSSDFRELLNDLEDWEAFDLSKEEKDTIAGLYQENGFVRKIDKKDFFAVKIKTFMMKVFGKLFCTNYEEIVECKENWCILERVKSDRCDVALRCG